MIKSCRFFLVFLLTALILVFITTCDNGTSSNDPVPEHNPVLVCFGNSLTEGYGAAVRDEVDTTQSYPAFLQEKLSIPIINAGISGDTTITGLARIHEDVLIHDPQMVIIELGANDVKNFVMPDTTKSNLQNIITLLNDGNRKIYLVKFYTEAVARKIITEFLTSDYNTQSILIKTYDELFDSLASSNKVELITDIWNGVLDEYLSDGIHPNAQGYKIMADNYFSYLLPYLQKNNYLAK